MGQIMHGWANYFRYTVAKNTFSTLDSFAWWRVIRMLKRRHHWKWTDLRLQFTNPTGRWLPITAGTIELRRIAALPVTRYRYRGTTIPNPWPAHPHVHRGGQRAGAPGHSPPAGGDARRAGAPVAPVARGAIHRGVRGDPHDRREHPLIWFDHAQYSVPHRLAGQTVRSAATVCKS